MRECRNEIKQKGKGRRAWCLILSSMLVLSRPSYPARALKTLQRPRTLLSLFFSPSIYLSVRVLLFPIHVFVFVVELHRHNA